MERVSIGYVSYQKEWTKSAPDIFSNHVFRIAGPTSANGIGPNTVALALNHAGALFDGEEEEDDVALILCRL